MNPAAFDAPTERLRAPLPVVFALRADYDNKTVMGFGEGAEAGGGELSCAAAGFRGISGVVGAGSA